MKRRSVAARFTRVLIGGLAAWPGTPALGASGGLVLHPSGFGPMSYSAWKAQQGEPDSSGNSSQALYFQKMTSTTTNAAGVAVIKGLEGMPASELTGLAWDHREDGHCGAGAPRWDVFVQDAAGRSYTVFLGCNAAQHTQLPDETSGYGWCHDTFDPQTAISAQTAGATGPLTISGLAIVFDEGNDIPNPPPAMCGQDQFQGGFVYLDNITVTADGVTHVWQDASDNGNGQTDVADPTGTNYVQGLLGLPVSVLNVQ